jgi:ABC-type Fe3+-hydroxamate transport system substrate-binding protein
VRRLVATLAALAAGALLAGCGLRTEPVGAGAASFPVTVTGGDGATVVIAAQPRRIVSADPAATATLHALGVPVTPIGAAQAAAAASAGRGER